MSKILIIEDDLDIRNLYKIAFAAKGHEVIEASEGRDGLAQIINSSPDIVLLDIMIPNMSGFEVLDELKKADLINKLKVFMLTNLSDSKVVEDAKAKGAIGLILKVEYTPKQVVELVESFVQNKDGLGGDKLWPKY